MNAAAQHEIPEEEARVEIEGLCANAVPVADAKHSNDDGRDEQIPEVEVVGVAYGNDDDAAQVVGYGKRGKEDLKPDGTTFAEDAQATEREGDVGCHWDGHASLHDGIAPADEEEDDDGNNHASAGSDDGGYSVLDVRQLAHEHLAFYLQAYAQEEDGHEVVVDELAQRHGMPAVAEDVEAANAEADRLAP